MRLHQKVAIVTGGATGIGEAIAHKFAVEGARVMVAGLPTDPVLDVVTAIRERGFQAEGFSGDLTKELDAKACVSKTLEAFGKLDILINNAGVFLFNGETQEYPIEYFDQTVTNNIKSTFLMTKFALPFLQETKGCVLATGSESGIIGLMENTVYGGTKGWTHAFIRGVAVEQAKYGVRANCVCPGAIDTAWTHTETGPMPKKSEKMLLGATPMARRGTPEEIANVFAFLASDEASFVTGALWVADGGITVSKGVPGLEVPKELKQQPTGDLQLKHSHDGLKNKDFENRT